MFVWISLAYATTWTVAVDGSGAFASIQAAVDASSDGDVVEVRAGTYFESVTLTKALTLTAVDGVGTVTIDGGDPVLSIQGATASLAGFRVEGDGVGMRIDGGEVLLADLTLSELTGAVDIEGDAIVVIERSSFVLNETLRGSAIRLHTGELDVRECLFEGNDAVFGASIHADGGVVTLSDNVFDHEYSEIAGGSVWLGEGVVFADAGSAWLNPYAGNGAGVYASGSASVAFVGSSFEAPSAVDPEAHGGAIYVEDVADLTLERVTVTDASAVRQGAGLHASMDDVVSRVTVTDSSFQRGESASDSGLSISGENTTVRLEGVTVSDSSGGAARIAVGAVEILDSTFFHNSGGGLYVGGGVVVIEACTFQSNNSEGSGGGVRAIRADLTVRDSIFRDNTADIDGGGLMLEELVALNVTGNRFEGNDAPRAAAAGNFDWEGGAESWTRNVFVENLGGSIVLLKNSVDAEFRNNTFVGDESPDGMLRLWGATADVRNNVFAFADGAALNADTLSVGTFAYNDLWGNTADTMGDLDVSVVLADHSLQADPAFVSWTAGGDFSANDLHPAEGSPLIDGGDPVFFDPDGSVGDIGAYFAEPADDTAGETGSAGSEVDSGADSSDSSGDTEDSGEPGKGANSCGCRGGGGSALVLGLWATIGCGAIGRRRPRRG